MEIIKQGIKFIGLSGIGWILDFITYACLKILSADLLLNNFVSSFVGVTFIFIFSSKIVFADNRKLSLKFKYVLYIVYQLVLVCLVSRLLEHIDKLLTTYIFFESIRNYSYIIAKILITPITMIINFIVIKVLMEKV